MKTYIVTFSYGYQLEAENEEEAEAKATEIFEADSPTTDEMNIDVKKVKNQRR